MIIGIIGAMEKEINEIKSVMNIISAKNTVGLDFYMGTLHGMSAVLVRSGVGKVNAAICTQILIDMYGVDAVINIGVAGAVSSELKIGDIVISDDLVNHDFDTTACGDEPGVITGIPESFFKADDQLIRLAYDAVQKVGLPVSIGRIGSGDQFVSSAEAKERIWKLFKAKCCEMEGAAIAQTCCLNKIPFVVIRTISDNADEDANVNYERFFSECAIKANCIIKNMFEAYH